MERRLAAILAADVVGYSRLMEEDEAGTLATLKSHRDELLDPAIAEHKGRIFKLMGDGTLAEFASVVDAVACAVAIQKGMAERNSGVADDGRIDFRIGVHLGDVIVEDDDLYGDGVNVAARLEGLAEAGGICISQQALDHVETKLELAYEDLGEQQVKNIARPVHAYNVHLDGVARRRRSTRRVPRKGLVAAAVLLLLIVAGGGAWQLWSPKPASVKPLIAVLPFDNFGDDEATGRLADGITEDIITDLARFPEFGVIARNSTEVYKDKAVDTREVGEALGVGYVLEGSIQRDGERLRITAQLIDAATGGHLWSERWDKPAGDVFAIQTEIAETVANRLGGGAGVIQQAGRAAARRKRPDDLDAYELYLLGTEKLEKVTREDIQESIRLLTRAVELDPALARAWVELYHAHNMSRYYGSDKDTAMKAATAAAEQAIALDPSDAEAHAAHAMALADKGEYAPAKAAFETALRIAPSSFEILAFYASWAGSLGEPERGAELAERAVELNPDFPMWSASPFAWAFFTVGRYEDAVQMLERLSPENYATWRWAVRAGSLASLGRTDEAADTVQQALEYFPQLNIESLVHDLGLTEAERSHWIETMRLAGFPLCAPAEERAGLMAEARLAECEGASEDGN